MRPEEEKNQLSLHVTSICFPVLYPKLLSVTSLANIGLQTGRDR